ncbi:glutamate racemase [Chitinophagaceae bacterium IBVUCB1]|nr:glutamate racemase [Chitinophagaceae bacterium IBVUCB1]
MQSPIGIFDSGYGGLTVFKSIAARLPQYDYIYLGDNGRAPYGNRSYETVHEYTLQCVEWFFAQGCELVILACNTASAKALRTIQQEDLPKMQGNKRVLGVIRPTAEVIGNYTNTKHIAVLGTRGTVNSQSYEIEIGKFFPDVRVHQMACPMWVPIVEYGEYNSEGADFFVKKYLDQLMHDAPQTDTILLACTHYPLLMDKIKKHLPTGINVIAQGDIVANSLADYLHRHTDMDNRLSKGGNMQFYTTDDTTDFDAHASVFFGKAVASKHLHL